MCELRFDVTCACFIWSCFIGLYSQNMNVLGPSRSIKDQVRGPSEYRPLSNCTDHPTWSQPGRDKLHPVAEIRASHLTHTCREYERLLFYVTVYWVGGNFCSIIVLYCVLREVQALKYDSLKPLRPICLLASLCMLAWMPVVHFEVCWPGDQSSGGVGRNV